MRRKKADILDHSDELPKVYGNTPSAAIAVLTANSRSKGEFVMKKCSRHRKSSMLCAALILVLLLTACGGGSSSGGSAGNAGNAGSTGAASGAAEKETDGSEADADSASAPGTPSAGAGGIIYDANDIEITLTDVHEEEEGFAFIDCELTNKGSRAVNVDMYPLVVNGSISISEGCFDTIEPGATVEWEGYINMRLLQFAGISSLGTVETYFSVIDAEDSSNVFAGPERITIVAGESTDRPAHSDQVIYDTDGVCISYLGSYEDQYDGRQGVFLVTNDAENKVGVNIPYDVEGTIDGKTPEDKKIYFTGAETMPGDCSLLTIGVIDTGTYDPAAFTALDTELHVGMDNDNWIPEQIPCHLKLEGDSLALTADAPYVTEEWQEILATRQEMAAEEQHEDEVAANAEEVKDPEIVKTGIYNYTVGTTSNGAVISALVHNPNERTDIYDVKLDCKAYGADDTLLGEPKLYYYNDYTILPGEDMTYTFKLSDLDVGSEVDHVEITLAGYDSVNELDLANTASIHSLLIPTDQIHLDDPVVSEGDYRQFSCASLAGTLVNDTGNEQWAEIVYVLYDKDGEIILSGTHLESELAAGEISDFHFEIGPAIYELPGYDHTDYSYYMKASGTE